MTCHHFPLTQLSYLFWERSCSVDTDNTHKEHEGKVIFNCTVVQIQINFVIIKMLCITFLHINLLRMNFVTPKLCYAELFNYNFEIVNFATECRVGGFCL